MDPTNTTRVPYIIYFYFLSVKEGKTHQLPRVRFSPQIDRKLCRERFCWENEYFVWKYPFSQTPKCSDCRRLTTNDNREMTDARTTLAIFFFSHNTGTKTKKALCTDLRNKSDFRTLSRVSRFFSVNGVSLVREIENPVWVKSLKLTEPKIGVAFM